MKLTICTIPYSAYLITHETFVSFITTSKCYVQLFTFQFQEPKPFSKICVQCLPSSLPKPTLISRWTCAYKCVTYAVLPDFLISTLVTTIIVRRFLILRSISPVHEHPQSFTGSSIKNTFFFLFNFYLR